VCADEKGKKNIMFNTKYQTLSIEDPSAHPQAISAENQEISKGRQYLFSVGAVFFLFALLGYLIGGGFYSNAESSSSVSYASSSPCKSFCDDECSSYPVMNS
jgi:hypothetical protein